MFSGKVFPPIECKYSVPRFTWTTAVYKSERKKTAKAVGGCITEHTVDQLHVLCGSKLLLILPKKFITTNSNQI